MFDLKNFRENSLKMTQAEFAALLEMRQDAISRLEKNTEQISLDVLQKIAIRTGMTLDQLVSFEKPMPKVLQVEDAWSEVRYKKNILDNYIDSYLKNHVGFDQTYALKLKEIMQFAAKKPKVIFLGRSDAGKSTMINALIGKEKMPTDWTPTTSVTVYVKHIDDRPEFISDELTIMKRDTEDECFDDSKLTCEEYYKKWRLAGGNAEMLSSYGTRKGEGYKASSDDIGAALIYVDSAVLKNCDLVDVPGFTGGVESDNITAEKAKNKADVLIYLSQAMGFFNSEDCINLKSALNMLAAIENPENNVDKFANLFVVATHAHAVNRGNKDTVEEILDDGCERFCSTLPNDFWKNRGNVTGLDYDESDMRKRFFSYTIDIESIRSDFENEFVKTIEQIPGLIADNAVKSVLDFCNENIISIDEVIERYNKLINERENCKEYVAEALKNEPLRKAKLDEKKSGIISYIEDARQKSLKHFDDKYDRVLSDDFILKTIEQKKYKNKKDDMQLLGSYISSELSNSMEAVLNTRTVGLNKKIEEVIADFENECKAAKVSGKCYANTFDAKRAFASGLTGAATLGGLALWASSLGNLGGYIIVAKGVSLLSALGVSIGGGTATAISAVSAIGGPITLGIAAAVIAALGVFGVLTGNWKNKVPKKLRAAFNDQNALDKYHNAINKYWDDTKAAFESAFDNMETEWQKSIVETSDLINDYNVENFERHISECEEVKCFFRDVPLQLD